MSDLQATRWCSAGDSALDDGEEAAFEAVTRALATPQPGGTLDPADTVLAVVFASSRHDLGRVAAGLRCALPQSVHLVGCTTSGEIFGGASRNSGLAVMLFGGEGFSVRTASATGLSHDSAGTGERAAELLYLGEPEPSPEEPERDVVLLLSDGLAGDQQAMVTGVYRVTGAAVPLVGGCAGDDLAMVATYQLIGGPDGDRVLQDSVVGVRLRSDAPIGIGVRHGWRRVGSPLVVTGTEGATVHTLDDEPALDAYLRVLEAPHEVREDPAAFTRFALDHPLGIAGRSQDLVRFVTGADFAARTLKLVAPVPLGGMTWLMTGDVESVLAASEEACNLAMAQLDGHPAKAVVAFDCIARRAALGSSTDAEVDRIHERTEGAPVIGFYTYGEIARTQGMSGFHNQTLVVLAVS